MQDHKEQDRRREARLLRRELYRDAERARTEPAEAAGREEPDAEGCRKYQGAAGRGLYESFSDEELLDVLRLAADELGHNPSQKEVFYVYCAFIRKRFQNWPAALRKAGLKKPKRKHPHRGAAGGVPAPSNRKEQLK